MEDETYQNGFGEGTVQAWHGFLLVTVKGLGSYKNNWIKKGAAGRKSRGFSPYSISGKNLQSVHMKDEKQNWLDWAVELQSLAQSALYYCKDKYDIERFERIREISAEIISQQAEDRKSVV